MKTTSFKARLITTVVLIPVVLLAVYYMPATLLLGGLILYLLAGYEWAKLVPLNKTLFKIFMAVALIAALFLCANYLQYWLILVAPVWVCIFIAILTFPSSQRVWGKPFLVAMSAGIILPPSAVCLWNLYQHPYGKDLLVYLFCLIWSCDVGAYVAGKAFGQHRLIPKVSPGKTIEGATGGLILAVIIAAGGYFYFLPANAVVWFVIAVITALLTIPGDLFISMLKRRCDIKDTGNIFPGHGGVLDRLDSPLAAIPFFYVSLWWVTFS